MHAPVDIRRTKARPHTQLIGSTHVRAASTATRRDDDGTMSESDATESGEEVEDSEDYTDVDQPVIPPHPDGELKLYFMPSLEEPCCAFIFC